MARFISIMNHVLTAEQLEQAKKLGEVTEVAFPNVSPYATSNEVEKIGDELISQISPETGDTIQVAGEPCLTCYVVTKLKESGHKVVTSTTERVSHEEVLADGSVRKTNVFRFIQFREF